MARLRERQRRDRERRILKAASSLFASRGYSRTAMEHVAASARLAVGTLYNYFPSKADLLLGVLRGDRERLLAEAALVVSESSRNPSAQISVLLDRYLAYIAGRDRHLWRELLAAAFADPGGMGRRLFECDYRMIAQLSYLFEDLKARGVLAVQADSGCASTAVYGIYFAWFTAYLLSETMSLEDLRAEIRRSIELVMRGLRAAPSFVAPAAG